MKQPSTPSTRGPLFDQARALFRLKLREGETILWVGRPRSKVQLRKVDRLLIPFSLVWLFGVGYWEYLAQFSSRPVLYHLLGLPFLLLGLWFAIGRFWDDARRRRFTWYVITDQRVLIDDRRKNDGTLQLPLPDPDRLIQIDHNGGYSTLYFPPPTDEKEARKVRRKGLVVSFDFIQSPEEVRRVLREARQAPA